MNQKKLFKLISLFLFVAFMLISCWATVDSLHLLLPTWPIPFFWIGTLGFFILASFGTKLIVDSFNQRTRMDNRRWGLIGGILLVLIFWGLFSLPTNTHTFFYRSAIKDVLVGDLTETKSRLQSLKDGGEAKKIIDQEKADFKAKISILFKNFAAEINNPGNPGWADKTENALLELEAAFGNNVKIQRLDPRCNTLKCRQELIEAMRDQTDNLVESTMVSVYDQRVENINRAVNKAEIESLIAEMNTIQDKIQAVPNSDEPTEKTSVILSQAYKIIGNYSDVLIKEFDKSHPDKIKLAEENKKAFSGVSKTEKMRSVTEVWGDFFDGKYADRGFTYWIIIAALVDIAGFIFFIPAFKKEDY